MHGSLLLVAGYENITTYDYIVRQRKRKMARDREQATDVRVHPI
jgi:hypothetical protein